MTRQTPQVATLSSAGGVRIQLQPNPQFVLCATPAHCGRVLLVRANLSPAPGQCLLAFVVVIRSNRRNIDLPLFNNVFYFCHGNLYDVS